MKSGQFCFTGVIQNVCAINQVTTTHVSCQQRNSHGRFCMFINQLALLRSIPEYIVLLFCGPYVTNVPNEDSDWKIGINCMFCQLILGNYTIMFSEQPKKMARALKFRIQKVEGLYCLRRENRR